MNILKTTILFLLITAASSFAQTKNICNIENWLGTWKGTLEINSTKNITSVAMEIIVAKTYIPNTYRWSIFYDEGEKKTERAYELKLKDLEKGDFVVDEKNDIILEMKYLNNSFYSMFDVDKNLIFARYTLKENEIEYETIACNSDLSYKTGSEKENSAIVTNYPVYVSQKANLKKQ